MLCEQCGVKEAEVNLVTVVNGERRTAHLCRECAETRLHLDDVTNVLKMSFSLEGLRDVESALRDLVMPAVRNIYGKGAHRCPHCGGVLPESMFTGAETQEEPPQESGVIPPMGPDEAVDELSKKMAAAVKEENYEFAARLRDRIAELRKNGTEHKV